MVRWGQVCREGLKCTAGAIAQNNAILLQVVEGGGAAHSSLRTSPPMTETVFFSVPGFDDKETLACRIEEFPGGVFTGFSAPRSG
jgi:hypothetical protein